MKRIFIVGDIILDTYIYGNVTRVSPEAPIPVLSVFDSDYRLGGAGNVAANVVSLGAQAAGLFIVGNDSAGGKLRKMLTDAGVGDEWIHVIEGLSTVEKKRIVGNDQQLARLDYEEKLCLDDITEQTVLESIKSGVAWGDITIISDYGKGLCAPSICGEVIQECLRQKKPVLVDPKGRDWKKYSGATIITPNMKELNSFSGQAVANEDKDIEAAYLEFPRQLDVDFVLLTRSEKGMTLFDGKGVTHIEARAQDVFDVSGAGDTAIAALAVSLDNDLSNIVAAVSRANVAAGIAVSKRGTAIVSEAELFNELIGKTSILEDKIFRISDRARLESRIQEWRMEGKTIATTGGCFDIIHRGHVQLLNKASALADCLVVVVNSDDSIRRLKGIDRPINSEVDRAFVLASLASVDAVVMFDPALDAELIDSTDLANLSSTEKEIAKEAPMGVLKIIAPDIHVKGGDYNVNQVPEAIYAQSFVSIPLVDGYSSSSLIEKMM